MEIKNYLLVSIVILAFALISVNLGDLTGSTTRDTSMAVIKVTPSSINLGEKINIEVIPGKEGVKNEIKIFKECKNSISPICEGNKIATITLCSGASYTKNCRQKTTKTYTTSISLVKWMYYAKITEYKKDDAGNYIERKAYFRIE